MDVSAVFSGDLVKVKLSPLTTLGVFSEFHPYWVTFARQISGKNVRLVKPDMMIHAPNGVLSEECFNGWRVDTLDHQFEYYDGKKIKPSSDFANWLPIEWLVPTSKEQLSLF